jgi:hypothetical protein
MFALKKHVSGKIICRTLKLSPFRHHFITETRAFQQLDEELLDSQLNVFLPKVTVQNNSHSAKPFKPKIPFYLQTKA